MVETGSKICDDMRLIRIFLSYARGDDEPFVRRLFADLKEEGFTVWFDRVSLLSRGLTFHQEIKDAIRSEVDRVIYIGGSKAACSAYVREEWQSALAYDHIVVTPILRLGDIYTSIPGELSLLHCYDFRDDACYTEALARLLASLKQPNPKLGALYAVPNLPANFLGRSDLMDRVRDALLIDLQKPQIIASADAKVGMQGMGGIGKSVLAAALARNREIRQAYPDGIIWISCGQGLTDATLLERLREFARYLEADDSFASLHQAESILRKALQNKAVLLVLDDVWQARDAVAFDLLGPRGRMLVTTRDAGILHTLNGELVPVTLFTETEALQLLADSVGLTPADLPPAALEVVKECGYLPLALALSGGMAKKRRRDFTSVLKCLRRADLDKIADRESINEQHHSIWRAMQASVKMLTEGEQDRFVELSVFAIDTVVPEAAIATLWAYSASLNSHDTEDLLLSLFERSLIQIDEVIAEDSITHRRFRLHDLLYDYAVRIAGEPKALQRKLLEAYRAKSPEGWHSGPNDGYFLENICCHMVLLEAWDDLVGVEENPGALTDLRFVQAKCEAGLVYDLVNDYNLALTELPEFREEQEYLKRRDKAMQDFRAELQSHDKKLSDYLHLIKNGSPAPKPVYPMIPAIIYDDKRPLMPEKKSISAARLRHFANFVVYHISILIKSPDALLPIAHNYAENGPICKPAEIMIGRYKRPWLELINRTAMPQFRPDCLRIIEAPDSVCRISLFPDERRLLSSSSSIRAWDIETGECICIIVGRIGWEYNCHAILPDSKRIVTASWKVPNYHEMNRAYNSNEWPVLLQLWEIETGECIYNLEGHLNRINCIKISSDGNSLVSASSDGTIRLWDLTTGNSQRVFECAGEGRIVKHTAIMITPNASEVISFSSDNKLRLWNTISGKCLGTYTAENYIDGTILPDDCFALLEFKDDPLKVLDLQNGVFLEVDLNGNYYKKSTQSYKLKVSLNRRLEINLERKDLDDYFYLRNSDKNKILWEYEGHLGHINDLCVTSDGRHAISAGSDKTIRIWSLEAHFSSTQPKKHDWLNRNERIASIIVIPDSTRAVSISDSFLRLWDLQTGNCIKSFQGHWRNELETRITSDYKRIVTTYGAIQLVIADNDNPGKNLLSFIDIADITGCKQIIGRELTIPFSFVLTPDGRRVISARKDSISNDFSLRSFDLVSCKKLKTFCEGHRSAVTALNITPDGTLAVSGSIDRTIRVWDAETGECLKVLEGHEAVIFDLAISPEGQYAFSVSADRTLRVWDLESGDNIAVYFTNCALLSVAVTPNGNRIICGDQKGRIHVLKLRNIALTGPAVITLDANCRGACPYCLITFTVCKNDMVAKIKQYEVEKNSMKKNATSDPGINSICPSCKRSLRFNPFFIHNYETVSQKKNIGPVFDTVKDPINRIAVSLVEAGSDLLKEAHYKEAFTAITEAVNILRCLDRFNRLPSRSELVDALLIRITVLRKLKLYKELFENSQDVSRLLSSMGISGIKKQMEYVISKSASLSSTHSKNKNNRK